MSEDTRARRSYDGTRRRERSAETRARIIEAAASAFLERGYTGATIPYIAEKAGVAVETVYRSASGKAGLLEAAVQAAVAGGVDRAEVPVDSRPALKRVIDEPDPRRKLEAYVRSVTGTWRRAGPLLRVLAAAASTDPALEDLRAGHDGFRRAGMGRFAHSLAEADALAEDVSEEMAGDILFTLCAQANYDSLVGLLGWSEDRYRAWLTSTLASTLLR